MSNTEKYCDECGENHYLDNFCQDCGLCLFKHGKWLNDEMFPLWECECGTINFSD